MEGESFESGADLGFSRGGGGGGLEGDLQKILKILSTFFRSTKLIYRALPEQKHPFWPNFLRCSQNFEKKMAKKGVFKHFLENFDKKKTRFTPQK